MTDAQETTAGPAAAAAAADDTDLDSEADDEARSKLENIKYYASLFLGTVSQSFQENQSSRFHLNQNTCSVAKFGQV